MDGCVRYLSSVFTDIVGHIQSYHPNVTSVSPIMVNECFSAVGIIYGHQKVVTISAVLTFCADDFLKKPVRKGTPVMSVVGSGVRK